jgi:Spy/CpxP family protein refolding chaperone
MRDLTEKATADIKAVLTDDQKTKADGVVKDLNTLNSVGIPYQTYGDLKLTDDQKTKLNQIVQDNMGNLREQLQGLDQDAARQKIMEIRTAAHTKAMAVLTSDQQSIVTKYEQDHPRRRGPAAAGA